MRFVLGYGAFLAGMAWGLYTLAGMVESAFVSAICISLSGLFLLGAVLYVALMLAFIALIKLATVLETKP